MLLTAADRMRTIRLPYLPSKKGGQLPDGAVARQKSRHKCRTKPTAQRASCARLGSAPSGTHNARPPESRTPMSFGKSSPLASARQLSMPMKGCSFGGSDVGLYANEKAVAALECLSSVAMASSAAATAVRQYAAGEGRGRVSKGGLARSARVTRQK